MSRKHIDEENLTVTGAHRHSQPPGISVDDRAEIEQRAGEARRGSPGIPWDEVKRGLTR